MNETVDQENPATQEEREERTFTQSEMDAMNRAKPVAPYGTTGCPPKGLAMARKKKFAPNDSQLTISYFCCFSLHAKRTHPAMRPFLIRIPGSYCSKPRRRGRSRRHPRF